MGMRVTRRKDDRNIYKEIRVTFGPLNHFRAEINHQMVTNSMGAP